LLLRFWQLFCPCCLSNVKQKTNDTRNRRKRQVERILYKRVTTLILQINFLFRVINRTSRNVICNRIVTQSKLIIGANDKIFACNFVIFSIAAILLYQCTGLGITAGAHRLWAHRSYKAKWPLQLILMIMNTIAFQVSGFLRNYRI